MVQLNDAKTGQRKDFVFDVAQKRLVPAAAVSQAHDAQDVMALLRSDGVLTKDVFLSPGERRAIYFVETGNGSAEIHLCDTATQSSKVLCVIDVGAVK